MQDEPQMTVRVDADEVTEALGLVHARLEAVPAHSAQGLALAQAIGGLDPDRSECLLRWSGRRDGVVVLHFLPGPTLLDLALPPETVAAWLEPLRRRGLEPLRGRVRAPETAEGVAERAAWRCLRALLRRIGR